MVGIQIIENLRVSTVSVGRPCLLRDLIFCCLYELVECLVTWCHNSRQQFKHLVYNADFIGILYYYLSCIGGYCWIVFRPGESLLSKRILRMKLKTRRAVRLMPHLMALQPMGLLLLKEEDGVDRGWLLYLNQKQTLLLRMRRVSQRKRMKTNFQHCAGVGLVVSCINLAIAFYVFVYTQLTYILLNEIVLKVENI